MIRRLAVLATVLGLVTGAGCGLGAPPTWKPTPRMTAPPDATPTATPVPTTARTPAVSTARPTPTPAATMTSTATASTPIATLTPSPTATPTVDPCAVEVYESEPREPFDMVGIVEVQRQNPGDRYASLLESAKDAACRLGGDGIVILYRSKRRHGGIAERPQAGVLPDVDLRAVVIRFRR